MKEFIIVITMFFADPYYSGEDAVEVLYKNSQPLAFRTERECFAHIEDNLEDLKTFAKAVYPNAVTIKQILCHEQPQKNRI